MPEKFKTFVCSYHHKGELWTLEIKAPSFEDAQQRLRSIGTNGIVDGELYIKLPVFPSDDMFKRPKSLFVLLWKWVIR